MRPSCRGRWLVLMLALGGLVVGAPLGCGGEKNKEERGLVVGHEQAVPESGKELQMTESQREAQEEREVEKKEAKEFEESQEPEK